MANNILSSELLGKTKESKGETSKVSTKGDVKSAPSLFDSLLKKTKQNIDQKETSNVKNIQVDTSEEKQEAKKPLSLFDRMNAKIESTQKSSEIKAEVSKDPKTLEQQKTSTQEKVPTQAQKELETKDSKTKVSLEKKELSVVENKNRSDSKSQTDLKTTVEPKIETKVETKTVKPDNQNETAPKIKSADQTDQAKAKEETKQSSLFDTLKKTAQQENVGQEKKKESKQDKVVESQTKTISESSLKTKEIDTPKPLELKSEKIVQVDTPKDLEAENKVADKIIEKESKIIIKKDDITKVETSTKKETITTVEDGTKIKTETIVKNDQDLKPLNIEEQKGDSLLDKIVASIKQAQGKDDKIDEVEFRVVDNDLDAAVAKKGQFYKESVKDLQPKDLILMKQYMQEQQHQKDLSAESALTSAKKVLMQNSTQEGMKQAAKILELNPGDITKEEIAQEGEKPLKGEVRVESFSKGVQSLLHRAYLKEETQLQSEELVQENKVTKKNDEVKETLKTENSDKTKDIKSVELRVERNAVEAFTSKVIDSKQRLNSFMSDMARQMYENYKPPITAFRINLNPANLGSIAILIKNNKSENNLSISMNMSKTETLETLNDNKTQLQNNISRLFPSSSSGEIALEFGMSSDSDGSEFASQYEEEKQKMIASGDLDEDFADEVNVDTEDYM